MTPSVEIAPAKLNLALHVRGKMPDGRHSIETVFAFCTDGDRVSALPSEDISLTIEGPFAKELGADADGVSPPSNLVLEAARMLRQAADTSSGARLVLKKELPVAAGLGGGSADAAAALRLLTSLWRIEPDLAAKIAPALGSDVPACLLSLPARGEGAGDRLTPIVLPELSGTPVLLVNPRVPLSTAQVFARWDGFDRGPLGDWREGRNDLQEPAIAIVPQIASVLAWLEAQPGASFVRMSGSGATCFALFESEEERSAAGQAVPREWWHLATFLR
ncbi:MAG TPA: 4-(cytidine 5'-diphospho)-2-C-methyl-D-erythritol kinase [Sphingomicrobium sp.]|nr:4-(cytidine 5'-diphospho)-2-C-methyl-D-erythritol kinase [Sphingomicrobium sp.]